MARVRIRKRSIKNFFKSVFLLIIAFFMFLVLRNRYYESMEVNEFLGYGEYEGSYDDGFYDIEGYKTDDISKLLANLEDEAEKGNEKAQWIRDNYQNMADVNLYLAGNDPDTINFVYNYQNGITDFQFWPGESVLLDRKTPYFLQWDNRWAYQSLSDSNIGFAGCGPTAMAMALARLNGDISITPDIIARDAEAYMTYEGISWDFFDDEARRYGYTAREIPLTETDMVQALDQGPLLVSVRRGYFTLFGHIMVIDSYRDGKFIINDPNSISKSQQTWSYDEISNQIAKIWLIN